MWSALAVRMCRELTNDIARLLIVHRLLLTVYSFLFDVVFSLFVDV